MKSPSFDSKPFPPLRLRAAARIAAVCAALCASARVDVASAQTLLTVRYPSEGASIGAVAATYAFGAAAPGATVTVNGRRAWIAADGAWTAFVPLHAGTFVFRVRSDYRGAVQEVDRSVTVDDGRIVAFPVATTIVQRLERLHFSISAPPGATVTADGAGLRGIALSPDPALGTDAYSATALAPDHAVAAMPVAYHIATADGAVVRRSRGTLAVSADPVLFAGTIAAFSPDPLSGARPYAMLGPTPDAPTAFMLPTGTIVDVTGRFGDRLRIAMPGEPAEYVDAQQVIRARGLRSSPVAVVRSVTREESARSTTLLIAFASGRPAFRVREVSGASGTIRIFGDGSQSRYRDIPFALQQHAFWGYTAAWHGSTLAVAFRKPPAFASSGSALGGLTVCVDPGHAPDSGAVGPLGTAERDVNIDIAQRLARRLTSMGARVVMTRTTNRAVLLYDRPKLAVASGADVLISVHNNANPDGVDPSKAHGFAIYYFQPHSLALAQAVHDLYRSRIDIPDMGLHRGDFALVRPSEMPAILTESAYVTWPWEEMRLRDPAFRQLLADTMAGGLERWADHMRAIESRR